jgi:beta-phosphoglucomutase-like phosphatase (HAD superfamily)
MIDTILFDLEGVIIDSGPIWEMADTLFVARRNYVFDNSMMMPLMAGKTLEEGVEILREHYPFAGDAKELAQERREIINELFQKKIKFIPGFLAFHKRISSKYKLAIGTSLEKQYLAAVDLHHHLSELFDDHVYSIADVNYVSKPNPDIFLYAASKVGSKPEQCVVIEDAPNGVEAAKRAGMKVIALTTGVSKEKLASADQIVDSYSEISLPFI